MPELSAEQIKELTLSLRSLKDDLERMIADSKEGARPVDLDQPIGRLSRMDAIQQQKMLESNRLSAKLRLRHVRAALADLDRDEYGECRECEEPIAYRRLQAKPESRFCISCKSAQEKRR